MKLINAGFLVVLFLDANIAIAKPICGFNIEDNKSLHFINDDACSLSIADNKNYLAMSYFKIDETKGIDKSLSDKNYFFDENGVKYFLSEEVDDPKVTIHVKQGSATKPVSFNGMKGYTSRVEYFVQKLPDFGDKDSGYSLNISCIFFAAGNGEKSFKSRFCTPNTLLGRKKLDLYRDTLMKVSPY